MRRLVHAVINVSTKYEVSIFNLYLQPYLYHRFIGIRQPWAAIYQ